MFLARADGHPIGSRSTEGAWNRRGATELLHDAHYTLLAGDGGKYAMGIIALGWLISNLIGGYLTLPRRPPFWNGWKPMWRSSVNSRLPRLLLDLHRANGLWLFIALAALAYSSTALNFFTPVYEPLVERLLAPKPSPFTVKAPFPKGRPGQLTFTRTLDLAKARAGQTGEIWKPAVVTYVPTRKLYGVTFTDTGLLNYHGLGPVSWFFDGDSGRFVHVETPYDRNPSLALIRSLYPIHSGRMGGVLGIALVFVLGLATLGHCVTGIYVWLKKRPPRVAVRRARKAAAP